MASNQGAGWGPLDAAAQELAAGQLRLAEREARACFHHFGGEVPLDELRAEARLALVLAAGRYQPHREVPFGAFATLVVRRELRKAVLPSHRTTGPPDHRRPRRRQGR